jgi:hypothetical protein
VVRGLFLRILATFLCVFPWVCLQAQPVSDSAESAANAVADEQTPEQPNPPSASPPQANPAKGQAAQPENTPAAAPAAKPSLAGQQPKRILGVMPNYKAVSSGAIPPPPTAKEAFGIATENSFDYSAFAFVGVTSLFAWGTDAHPQLRSGIAGYGRYYWRGFVDKADGNYLVLFAFPTLFRQDERYYELGKGGFWKRVEYSASRTLITPNYHGRNSFNFSEILGRAAAEAVSVSYYPSESRTVGSVATRFGYAVMRDTFTNMFREFWPDIAIHVLHRHP